MPLGRARAQICPFYLRESAFLVSCEGLINGTFCAHKFASPAARQKYQSIYCETYDYVRCVHAAVLLDKYECEPKHKTSPKPKPKEAPKRTFEQLAFDLHGVVSEDKRCALPGRKCSQSQPFKDMCCRCCSLRKLCTSQDARCENDPTKCGYAESGF